MPQSPPPALVSVSLGANSYPVYVGSGLLAKLLPDYLTAYKQRFWIIDKAVAKEHQKILEPLSSEDPRYILASSEEQKQLKTAALVYEFLIKHQIDRQSLIIAIGGGVIGDLSGFIASTILRGVRLIMIPTTLLAQVDSSIGGKNGLNFPPAKNMVGTFYQPQACLLDVNFLTSLPPRELCSGFAEIIKHGLIKDQAFFELLTAIDPTKLLDDKARLIKLIKISCEIKAAVVASDEREQNKRALLNFGHSLGHLLEAHSGYSQYRHGECVIAGMSFACYVSLELGYLAPLAANRIQAYLSRLLEPLVVPVLSKTQFLTLLACDKKVTNGKINFIALREIGAGFILPDYSSLKLHQFFLKYLQQPYSLVKLQ